MINIYSLFGLNFFSNIFHMNLSEFYNISWYNNSYHNTKEVIFITIEQIQYFLAVKKYCGFLSASHELCISQSSLSKQIKSLERELDTLLFDRSSRNIKLTPAGEEFSVHCEKLLNNYNDVLQKMKKYSISQNITLKLGTIAVLSQYGLTPLIASFANENKNIDINIVEDENEKILSMLRSSTIDLAIIRNSNLSEEEFDITHIAKDELVIVTSNNHDFCKKENISFSDLKDESLIICTKSGVYSTYVNECAKANITPNVIYNINKIETIIGLVSEGLGITAIVCNVLNPFLNDKICVHHLKNPINSNLVLVTRKNSQKQKYIELFKKYVAENISELNKTT